MFKVVISHSGKVICELTEGDPIVRLTCKDTTVTDNIDIELIEVPDEE